MSSAERLHYIQERYLGSGEAERRFVNDCRQFVTPIVKGMMRNSRLKDDYEDAVQEVVWKAARKLKSFDGASQLSTWAYRIAVHESLDFVRDQHAVIRDTSRTDYLDELLAEGEEIAHPGETPEDIVIREDRAAFLGEAIRALSPRLALAVRLDLEGFTDGQIAEMTGRGKMAVTVGLRRAKVEMREYLRRHGFSI